MVFILGVYQISVKNYRKKTEKVKVELQKRNLNALVLMNSANIAYMSGFFHISTERPIQLIIPVEGDLTLIVPKLEEDQSQVIVPWIEDIVVPYFDTPGVPYYLTQIANAFKERRLDNKKIGIDGISVPWGGPIAEKFKKELPEATFIDAGDIILDMRLIKDYEEINLMRESYKWSHLAMSTLYDYIEPGANPSEIALQASYEATCAMLRTYGPDYGRWRLPIEWGPLTVSVSLRCVSPWYFPHWMNQLPPPGWSLQTGGVLKIGGSCRVGGYHIEQSRQLFLGEPLEKHKKRFMVHLNAKLAAFEAIKPGAKCSDIDRACNMVIKDAGMGQWLKHHTGHGLGLQAHEAPWIDEGNDTVLRPGMVFSIEPGLFLKEEDMVYHNHESVVVTEDGYGEWLSTFPRDLVSCTIKV